MKLIPVFGLVGLCLGQEKEPTALEAELAFNPKSYASGLYRVLKPGNARQLVSQIDEFPPKRMANLTQFKPIDIQAFREGLEMAYITMCPEQAIMNRTCICGEYTDIGFARDKDLRASATIGYHPRTKQVFVSYRYTTGLLNWIGNFDFLYGTMDGAPEGVRVHRGMMIYYRSIHNQTMAKAAELVRTRDVRGVFVTGYSLGASIAVVSTPYWATFKQIHNVPVTIMSYSGARTGNLQAKLYFESLGIPINRYTNRDDLIPQIPPRSLGYTHAGLEIHETPTGPRTSKLVVCSQEYDEDPDCAWGEPGLRRLVPHMTPFNHPLILPPYCGKSVDRTNLPDYE